MAWVGAVLTQAEVSGRRVLEVGSYDVNGSVRPVVERLGPAGYLGVDATAGPRVDRVVDCTELVDVLGAGTFDVVISTEMLEHVQDWRACMWNMAEVLAPGGLLLLSTRAPGFPYHAFPVDCWRFTLPVMSRILTAVGLGSHELAPDPDPRSPGVLVKARKSEPWLPDRGALERIEAEAVPQP